MADNDKISKLYNALIKSGYSMASEDVFRERLKDPTKRKAYYDAMVESGYKMRPFSEFETNIGYGEPVQAENPAQAPASTVPTNGDTELAPQNGTSEQHWTPTEQEKIRMSYEMHFGKDEYVEDGVDENGKTKYKLQHTPGLMETQRKMQAQTDQVKRLAESYTPEGRKKANVAKTTAQVMGLPTKVMGLTPPVSSGKDPEGQTEEAQEAPRFTNDPIPYGVKMVDGKPTVEWLLPDGRLTTSMTEADQSAFVSRHNRLQHQFEVRMKQNGLDVSNEDDVKVQASIDAIQSGIGLDENVRQQIIKEVEDNGLNPMDGEHLKWMMKPGFERQLLEHRLSVAEERLKDLNQRRAAILNAQAPKVYNGPVYPGAVKPSASVAGTAQTPLDRDIEYATAEVAKLSKSLKDYDQNKAAAGRSWIGNLFHGLYEGILDVDTWTFGVVSASVNHTTRNANANTAAGANLLQSYLQSEELLKSAPAAGAVYGGARFTGEIIGDFSTYLSLGFGNIVRKGATKAIAKGGGKKIAGDVAERLATNNKLARYGGAALGHGANFGAFEGLRDIRQQWIDGGYTDDEGNFHEGFSFAHAAQQGIHGFTLGVPMGIFGTWVGNAGNRMVKSVDNIAGKAAIKGGQFGLSVVGEGTIFASKEIADFLTMQDDKFDELYAEHYGYDKETDPQKRANARAKARAIISWDAWTQSAANIFGMKVAGKISHPGQLIGNVKSTIAELRRDGARHGMNFREKVKMMLDRSPLDIKLTKEEREELKRFGYGDLADIFVKEGEQGKNGVEVGNLNETSRTPVGDPNGGMDLVTGDFKQSEYDGYATMEKLMNDKRVSEASRAKLYFILTGKMLPMSTITGWNMVESEDGQTFSINSYNSEGGVVTSKTFRYDSKSAGADSQREVARIKRQVELNTVNVGEQLADVAATKKIAERAFKSVGAKHNLIPEAVSYIYDRYEKGEHLSEAEAAIIADINTIVEGNLEYGASLRPAAFKERIKEEYDVDVDKALLKEPEKRTDAERNAIADYMDMLYHEADRDRMAREVWGQEYEQMRDEEKAARRRAYRMQMDGRLLAEGKPEDPTEADRMGAEAIYEEAKQTFDKVEQGNPEAQAEVDAIGLRVQEAWTLCEEAFGDQADYWMFHVENDPWRLINDPALTADQQEAVLYYINSKAAMDGVLDASNEASDRKRAEVENTITARTHRDLKQIIPATMKVDDRQVYVVKGNVTMHEDGSAVDVRNSDQSVVVMDAETGKLEFSSPDRIFKLGEAIDPAQELETAYAAIQAEQDAMLGNNTGGPKTGESVPKTTENGGSDAENVHKPVSTVGNGQEGKPLTKDEEAAQHVHNSLEGAIVDQWGKAMDDAIERTGIEWLSNPKVKFIFGEYAKGCKSIEEVAERAIADQDDPRTAQRIKNLLKFKSTRALLERLLPKSNDTEGAPQSALSRIPTKTVGKEEEPDFTAVDKATALDGLMEAAGGNEKLATDIILAQVKQSREDVEALKKKPPTKKQPKLKGSPMAMLKANEQAEQEYAEAMTQYKADLAEKERIMQAWYDISSELSRRNSEARAAREAEQQARNIQAHDAAVARFEEEQRIKAEKQAEQERIGVHAVNPKIRERWEAAPKIEGNEDALTLPDDSTITGRYILTEAGAASPSHDANNAYEPTEGFPIDENGQSVNDRDYMHDKDAQQIVEGMASSYDNRALQDPVIVSKDGVQTADAPQRGAEPQSVAEPTEAQKAAGNYKMEHRRVDGYNVSIENPKGSVRRGTGADGKPWETLMHNDYGYIRGTEGVDGDHIDVFLSDTPEEGDVFVVDQVNKDGSFDEHKVMYGFPSVEDAREAYLSNYEPGWTGLGAITHVSKDEFKKWIGSSKRKTKPFADYKSVKPIEGNGMIGRSLTDKEATELIERMEATAEIAPTIELTPENWIAQFGEEGAVDTPIGTVKMGENQYFKMARQGREGKLGMVKPTLQNPDVVVEDYRPASTGRSERDTSYIFVKTFNKEDGSRYYYFTSVTVRKDGREVVISNQERSDKRISKLLQQGKVAWIDNGILHPKAQVGKSVSLNDSNNPTNSDNGTALLGINSSANNESLSLSSERYLTEASGDPKGPDLVPTSDNVSSEGKVTTLSSDKQEKAPESSEGYTLEARKDTRDNSDLYAVKFEERVSKDEFKGQKAIAKKHGGYWSNFGKKGFLFKTEQEARDFANEVLGKTEDAVADEAPLTTQDIRNIVEPLAEEPKAAKPKRTAPAKPKPANTATVEDIKPTPATEPEKPAEEPKKEYNVSDEEMNSLLGDIRDLLGIDDTSDFKFRDPDDMSKEDLFKLKLVGIRFAMAIVERGNPKFEDYARLMVKNLGDKIRPWVKQFYGGLYFEPGFDTSVLTPFEEVQAFDIANFEKPDNNPFREAETIAAEQKAKKADEKATKEITEIRNQNRKKEDEQTSADTAALASEAETVAGEAESVAETSASEPELNGAAERIDAALEKVNDQLALLGYYEADPNAPEHEIYGRRRSAEKKAVKDATKLAQQLVDDLGMDFTKANLTEPDRHGRMKIKPLAVANVAPAGGDIVINLPYPDGRNLHINIGIVPTHEKGVEPKRGGGAWEGDNYEVDSIMFRFEDDSHSGHNRFLPADVTYSNLLDAIKKESRWGMTKAEAETKSSEQVMSELGDMLERGESPYTVTPEVESELAKQREGEYKPGEKVLYSSDDGRTWEDATVEGMDGDMITLDTGHAPIMYVNAYPEQVRRPQQGGVQPREDIFQEANRIAKETQEKKKSVSSRKKPKVKPEQPVADLFGGLFDQPNDNEQDTSNSGGQAVANAERPNTVGNDATGVDGGERPLGSGRTDGEQSTDGSRAAVGDRADADAHATGSVGTLRKPGGNRGRNESGTAGAVSKPVDGGGTAGAGSTRGQGADGGAEAVSEGKPAAGTRAGGRPSSVKKPKHKFTRNFNYEEVGNDADHYTPPQRLEANVSAVETIAKIIREGDRPATDEEKLILSRFRGWGQVDFKKYYSLSHIKQNTRHNDPLHRLATAIESIDPKDDKKLFDAIKTASLTAFYTPVPVAAAMNSFLPLAGFHGGSMLDPSTGNGIFEGTLSKALQERTMITGIELDWLTARIARALYPDADIRINGYESAGITPGSMDVVTTNMPFGDTTIYDPTWKSDSSPIKRSAQKRIHNYFAVKMLESARPGGLVSMMTTTSVMDTKSNQNVRMHIAEQGEILGAIRLPGDVFQGTGAVSDIIYVRKWRDNEDAQATRSNPAYAELERAFLSLHETTAPNKRTGEPRKVAYNGYYKMHPDHMLGEVVAGNQYGDDGFGLRGTRTVDEVAAEIKDINMKIVGDRVGQLYNPTRTVREVHEAIGAEYKGDGDWVSNGNLVVQDGKIGELTTATNKYGEVTRTFVEKPGLSSQRKKVESMIELRTAMKELIAAQIEGKPDNILDMMRRKLKGAYDRFTAKNGKLKANDFLLEDIDGYTLQGLEKWEDGKFVGLADIFTKNTIKPALRLEDASTPQEAIATSLAEYGELRGEYMEKVLGEGWHDQCKDYVFEVPNSDGRFVTKDEYLSGDVVSKLQEAKAASMLDPRFENNVKALEEVQPTPIPFDDIAVHLGARWIPIEMINDFVKELFGIHASSSRNRRWVNGEMVEELKSGVVYVPEMDTYIVNIEPKELGGEATDWETGARSAKQVLEAALSDKTLTVSKTDSKGNKFLDEEATELVNQKVQDMRERFEQWLSTDDARMEAISEAYNERFNRTVLRKWDGSHLNIPGLMGKELRPHQKDAVWMLINNRGGIVDHIVGAGKTLVMQAAIMEMRRMGIAKKPMIVALKSTVGQIAREFKCAFPSARVLAPSDKDFEMSNRKKFIANIALNDYDCVILSHEQYCKLPHTEEAEQVVIQEQLAQLDAIIQYLYGTGDKSQLTKKQIKALEKRRENLLAKMKQRLDRSVDREFCFEDLGVDYLFVDECHQFRSLPYVTSYNQVAGLGPAEGSNKAVALLTGMRYLQKMHQGDKGTIFLSGTTINNSLVEIYNLLNYLRPRKLEALGMTTFDAWASTFAVHSAEIEAGTTGEFKSKDRFRSFDNVPELSQLYAEIADVRNDMNLQLPKPAIDARTVIVKESDALHEINQAIIDMLNTKNGSYFGIYPKGEPRKHSWGLDASTLSAKAAISPKLIFPDIEDDGGKIASVCENVGKIFKETAEHKGVQLIFCELGVPGPGKKYDAYTDMINRLSKEYGIPRKAIAYIQQAKNDKEKEELFQRVRNGEVRILIGGTKNMGTGVNVQDRITDLHMLSVPWQPASLEQCIGRGARQGNIIARDFMGNKVRVHYYATEGSLDLYKFQLLDAKGKMFTQFKMGTISGDRNFDEGSSDENGNLDPAEMVAILSGNPVIFEKSKQDKLVKKLKAAYNGFLRDVQRKKVKRAQLQESIEKFDRLVTISDRDVDKLKRGGFTPDEEGRYPSRVTVKVKGEYRGETFDKPKECGEFILENLKENKQLTLEGYGFEADVVFVAGDDLLASAHYEVQTGKEGFWGINYTKRLSEDATAAGCAFRSLLEQIISNNAAYKNGLAEKKRLLETMPEPSDVFPKQKELDEAVAKKRELDAEYNKLAKPDTPQDAATGDKFRLRTSEPPKRTGIGYKVFVLKDGKLYSPMVANADRSETPTGVWLDADPNEQFIIGGKEAVDAEFAHVEPWLRRYHVQAGGKGTQGGSGKLAFRPGWHLGQIPFAAQFGRVNPETGEKELFPNNFVWAKVEYAMDEDYQHESDERMYYDKNGNRREKPTHSLGGLNHVPENGYYTYRTNPDPTTDPWIITGAMRVIEIMKPSEVDRVVSEAGRAPQLRQEGAVTDAEVEALNRDLRKRMDTDGTSMSIRVREIAEELHTPVELITTPEEIKQLPTVRHQNAKGWFKDGKVYVVVPNNTNVADVENTAIHEIVGHKGLRELVGEEHFNLFLDEIYDHASDRIKADINKRAEKAFDDEVNRLRLKYGNGYFGEAKAKSETYAKREQIKRDATEEYMCDMAGKIGHDGFKKMQEDELTLWGKIKAKFMKFMDKILKGLRLSKGVKFTDKDIAYILFKSWQKAKGKTGIFAEAEDIAMRNATHFNESEEAMRFRWFGKKKSVNLQHGKEGTEQNQSIGHNRSEQAKGNERGGVSAPVSGGLATGTDRSSIRVFEEGLAAHRERHSDYSTRERQEAEGERLIAIAKEKGLFFTKEQVKDFGEKVRQLSRESDVYINHSEGRVYKVKNPYANAGTWKNNLEPEDAIYEFLLHNKYFPNTAYKFEGIAEDADGVRIVLSQPYVEARHQASDEEVDAYLAAKGLKKEAWYTYGNEEVIVSDCVDENALIGQDGDLYIIDPVIDVRKPILELIGPFEPDTDGGAHFRDGDMSLQEAITKLKLDIASAQGDNAKAKEVAVRAIGSNLQELRKAMSRQRLYDLQTVKSMTDLAQLLMEHNMLDDMSKYEVSRILSAVKNSPGHISKDKDTGELRASGGEKNLQHQVDSLLDLMVNNQLRKAQNSLSKLLSVQGSKVDARGVKVQGELDAEGVIIARTLKHNLGVPAEIYDAKGDLQPGCIKWAMQEVMDKMGDADARVAERAAMEYAGLQIAMQYANDITKSKAEEKLIKDSLNTLKENKEGGKIDAKAYSQAVEAVYDSLRANKLERAEAYFRIVDSVAGVLGESIERAKAWREEQKQRVRDIQHNCNSDMEGRVLRGQRKDDRLDGIVQSTICRIFLEPLATFDQMLRMLGGKNANGEGYLWNRYMHGWTSAAEREQVMKERNHHNMDEAAADIFGKGKKWGYVYDLNRALPKSTVTIWDGGEMREHELTQLDLLTILIWDAQPTGRATLRNMGIDEVKIGEIENFLDPRMRHLGDWMVGYLSGRYQDYNEVYKRLFGAPMTANENYFPFRRFKDEIKREVENGTPADNDHSSITTGAVKERKFSLVSFDIVNSNAADIFTRHLDEMEHWSSFAELNRDIGIMLSYNRLKQQVQQMHTAYGSGKTLWNRFEKCCAIATESYEPKVGNFDKLFVKATKGVAMGKVNLRLFTALKQTLSLPAFLPDCHIGVMSADLALGGVPAVKWAWKNMPLYRKRVLSRTAGDYRLKESEYDTKLMRLFGKGMLPNIGVDAWTIAIGAHAVYKARYNRYRRYGMPEKEAEARAIRDAEISFNESQQSSEGPFLAPIQVDHTAEAFAYSLFRNSAYSYTRKTHEAARNLRNLMSGNSTVEYMTKQLLRDLYPENEGAWSDDQVKHCEAEAKRQHRRAYWKNAVQLGTFGWILPWLWRLGGIAPLLLLSSDDDERDKAARGALLQSTFGPFEGLAGGDVITQAANMALGFEEPNWKYISKQSPMLSDVADMLNKLGKDNVTAMNDILNIVVGMNTGLNPASITDMVVAVMDYCESDKDRRECALLIARILNCPPSQMDKVYFDELDLSAKEASAMTPDEIAERYARYKMRKDAPLTGWLRSQEAEDTIHEAKKRVPMMKAKERLQLHTNTEETRQLLSRYDAITHEQTEIGKLKKTDRAEYLRRRIALREGNDMREHRRIGRYKRDINELTQRYLRAKTTEERDSIVEAMIAAREKMLDDLNSYDMAEE